MGRVDFTSARKSAEKEGLVGGSDYLKIQEGANRIRLLTECLPHPGEYQGRKTFKWLCYVLDRADGSIRPFFMPHTVYKLIEALQSSEDYAFEEVPMPYDITLNAKGAGTRDVEYSIVPARKNTPITPADIQALAEKMPLRELRDLLRGKETHHESSEADRAPAFDPDEVPL